MTTTPQRLRNLSSIFPSYPDLLVRRRSLPKIIVFSLFALVGIALSIYVYSDYPAAVALVSDGRRSGYAVIGITIMGPLIALLFLYLLIARSFVWRLVSTGEKFGRIVEHRFYRLSIDPSAALAVITRGAAAGDELKKLLHAAMLQAGKGDALLEYWGNKNSKIMIAGVLTGKAGKMSVLGEPVFFRGDTYFDYDSVVHGS